MDPNELTTQIGTILVALGLTPWILIPTLENRINPQGKKIPTATINVIGFFLALGGISLLLNQNNQARALSVALGAIAGGLISCIPTLWAYKKPNPLTRRARLGIAGVNWLANLALAIMLYNAGLGNWVLASLGLAAASTLYLFALKRRRAVATSSQTTSGGSPI